MTSALRPLENLAGVWVGTGLSVISLPDRQHDHAVRLQVNVTHEVLTFTPIDSQIADRAGRCWPHVTVATLAWRAWSNFQP